MIDNASALGATMRSDPPLGAARLLDPIVSPLLQRSSPHLMTFAKARMVFGGSARRQELLTLLVGELDFLRSHGLPPLCLLLGGSFVRECEHPNDLDALIVYRLAPDAPGNAIDLLLQRRCEGLDLRFVPGDAGPIPLLKVACFFHTLYQSHDHGGDQASYLISLQD